MTCRSVALGIAGLAVSATAFLPAPATWTRRAVGAQTVVVGNNSSPSPTARGSRRGRLHMKKETSGGAAKRGGEDGDPRRQALDGVLNQIERCYGRGSILKMGDTTSMNVETTPTGGSCYRCDGGFMIGSWCLACSLS